MYVIIDILVYVFCLFWGRKEWVGWCQGFCSEEVDNGEWRGADFENETPSVGMCVWFVLFQFSPLSRWCVAIIEKACNGSGCDTNAASRCTKEVVVKSRASCGGDSAYIEGCSWRHKGFEQNAAPPAKRTRVGELGPAEKDLESALPSSTSTATKVTLCLRARQGAGRSSAEPARRK